MIGSPVGWQKSKIPIRRHVRKRDVDRRGSGESELRELLPEEEVFEKQVMPAAKNPRYDGEQEAEKFEHQVRITDRPRG
jgi:hypothetical protein